MATCSVVWLAPVPRSLAGRSADKHDQSLADVDCFEHRRMEIGDSGAGGGHDRDRAMRALGQSERQEARRTLVDAYVQTHQALGVGLVQRPSRVPPTANPGRVRRR